MSETTEQRITQIDLGHKRHPNYDTLDIKWLIRKLRAARKDTERLDGLLKRGCYLGHMSHRIRDRAHLDELLQTRSEVRP